MATVTALHPLQRFVRATNERRYSSRCERCGEPLRQLHRHIVDLEGHRLLCTCQACTMRASEDREGQYRVIPERVRSHVSWAPTADEWRTLGIPGQLAFFVRLSRLGRWVAVVPSAAGAAEVGLPRRAWDGFVQRSPIARYVAPDVEALLMRGTGAQSFECFLTPIDICYELVALVRQNWRGLDGGDAARAELDAFFERLRRRTRQ